MISSAISSVSSSNIGLIPEYDVSKIEPLTLETTLKYSKNFSDVQSNGKLIIPSVNINLNIYEGINNQHLMLGAAEQMPRNMVRNGGDGNYVLVSHLTFKNKKMLFTPLKDLQVGDKIYTIDNDYIYIYKTVYNEIFHISDTSPINEVTQDKLITLYCCFGDTLDTEYRRVVRGEYVSRIELDEVGEDIMNIIK